MKKSRKVLYIHTLDGYPAAMSDRQICFVAGYGKAWAKGCSSLREIRKQLQESRQYQASKGYSECYMHGYVRICL